MALPNRWLIDKRRPNRISRIIPSRFVFKTVSRVYGVWSMPCAMDMTSSAKPLWKLGNGWWPGLKTIRDCTDLLNNF